MIVPCYRGGHHCKWPACPLDCDGRVGQVGWSPPAEMTHCLINGVHYVKTPGGNWAPDFSQPGTVESVKESVDEAVEQHWSIDKWQK